MGSSEYFSVFSGVFIAENIHRVRDMASRDSRMVHVQKLLDTLNSHTSDKRNSAVIIYLHLLGFKLLPHVILLHLHFLLNST